MNGVHDMGGMNGFGPAGHGIAVETAKNGGSET